MPETVFTLTETTDRTQYIFGVFKDRSAAIDAARSWAQHLARRYFVMDEKLLKRPQEPGTYRLATEEEGGHATIYLIHTPSGERDLCSWQVSPFDLIEANATAETEDSVLPPVAI